MTEDDAVGGLEAVLARELEKQGLPPQAGLTGLLTHPGGEPRLDRGRPEHPHRDADPQGEAGRGARHLFQSCDRPARFIEEGQ